MAGTSLPAWLATLEQNELAEVLAARADVCGPAEPAGWGELAERLQQRQSVEQALKRLPRPCLQVAEAAAALGPGATRAAITALLSGPGAATDDPWDDLGDDPWDDAADDDVDEAVDEALTTLERHALVWPGPGGVLHVAEALRERWPARRAAAGERAPFDPFPPDLPTTVLAGPVRVDLTAAAQLGTFLGQVEGMLAECARRPLQVFKAAGMKPAALGRVMGAARCDEASARLAVACAQRAGLLAGDGTHVRLAPGCDAFTLLPPGEQAARLLFAWWRLPSAPTRTHSDNGKQLHPLSPKAVCAGCVQVRHVLVPVLREVPDRQGVRAPEDLAAALEWHRPLACDHAAGHPPHSVREAMLLGVVAHGVLSSFGALLAAEDYAGLAQEASRLLPPFAEHAEITPRHMVTVRGTPSRRLAKELDAVADRQFGPVWQISNESLRRAWETGLRAGDIEACLAAISAAPLPPSLRSRIAAAVGGRVHVQPPRLHEVAATCVFHSTDTALVARAIRDPALQALGVRQLSPGVLVATGPRESVLAALRAAGFAAIEDSAPAPPPAPAADEPPPDFDALAERLLRDPHVPSRSRARPLRRPRSPASRPTRPARPRTALERAERVITREALELNSNEIRLLAQAVAEDRRVRIIYVSREGEETDRGISPPYEVVDNKLLKAICEMRSAQTGRPEERMFNLARIQSVQAVDD